VSAYNIEEFHKLIFFDLIWNLRSKSLGNSAHEVPIANHFFNLSDSQPAFLSSTFTYIDSIAFIIMFNKRGRPDNLYFQLLYFIQFYNSLEFFSSFWKCAPSNIKTNYETHRITGKLSLLQLSNVFLS
jgi:hypothetical protein